MNRISRLMILCGAIATVGALSGLTGSMSSASAASHVTCVNYANIAVAQQRRNIRMGCGYRGPRWHFNWGAHYAWCRTVPFGVQRNERLIRRNRLAACGAPRPSLRRTFNRPRIGGVRLDWCKFWARDCGRPAANAYCRRKGFRRAVAWRQARDIGRWMNTRVIATGQICSGAFCDGFRYITCVR